MTSQATQTPPTTQHEKIRQLRLRANPVTYTSVRASDARAAAVGDDMTGKAYFCVWGVRDTYGTMFMKGCCSRSIDLRGPNSTASQKILMCWQHDPKDPIAQFTEIKEDDYGLYGAYKLDDPESVPSSKRAKAQINSGTINQYSIGFDYMWDKMEYDEKTDSIILKEIDLFQMDPVTTASLADTHTLRSRSEYDKRIEFLNEETDDFIKSLPRSKQLDIRQLILRHKTLAKVDPALLETLSLTDPDETGDGFNISSLVKLF